MNQVFLVTGMHCEACTKLTAKRIRSISGVQEVTVDLAGTEAVVSAERRIDAEEINDVLEGTDYRVEEVK